MQTSPEPRARRGLKANVSVQLRDFHFSLAATAVVYPQSKQASSRPCFSDLVTHSFVSQGGANNKLPKRDPGSRFRFFAFDWHLIVRLFPLLYSFSSLCLSTDLCFALTGSTPSLEPRRIQISSVSFNTEVLCPISRVSIRLLLLLLLHFCRLIHGCEGDFGHV